LKQTSYSRVGGGELFSTEIFLGKKKFFLGIFGQSLEDTYKYSHDKSSLVPLIVRHCCEYLVEYGLTSVGLFR